jgi:LmbE family N-acetylglucosaminyl deacetylase
MDETTESVLAVVAHPDDEVLGVGGALARESRNRDVHVCILSDGVIARYEERTQEAEKEIEERRQRARNACSILGCESVTFYDYPDQQFDTVPLLELVQAIEDEIDQHEPSTIYTHHYGDLNLDHELTCRAVQTATRPLKDTNIERVLAFETLSATEWAVPSSSNAFQPSVFIDINDYLGKKLEALEAYESELATPPHPRTVDTVRRNAHVWGDKAGMTAAEPFELLRELQR